MDRTTYHGMNGLLAALPPDQRQRVIGVAKFVSLTENKVLTEAEQPIQFVYFPTTAVLSVLSVMTNGIGVETAVVGWEGMAPLAAFHHVERAAEQVIVQVPGDALRISRQDFHAVMAEAPAMRRLLHPYSQALFTFAAQSSACNRQHSVVQRCARWLLTTHDRVPGDEFYLTHLFLSQMLGVRRSSVTIAAEVLRAAGAITYTRGRVRIANRELLLSRSCECYSIIRSTYDRLLAGRDTPSPLHDVSLSEDGQSLLRGGHPYDAHASEQSSEAAEQSFTEFSGRLREARQRSERLRSVVDDADVDPDDFLRLSDELSMAFEQLDVAEEEMRVQLAALEEMRSAMEAQQQLWRSRFEGLPDAFIETDQDETITELNRAAELLLGKSRTRLIGKPLTSLFQDTDRRALRSLIAELKNGTPNGSWSGTVIGAGTERPTVDVAVSAAAANRSTEAPRYAGARWLLRPRANARRSPA